MLKIVYFCNFVNTAGGLDKIIIQKANYLCKNNDVYIVTTQQPEKTYFYSLDLKVKHIDFSEYGRRKLFLFEKWKFKKIMEDIIPDIIISPTGKESFFLPFFDADIPKVKEMHFSRYHRQIQNRNANIPKKIYINFLCILERKIYSLYDAVVPLTYEDEKEWRLDNTTVIYNFKTINSAAVSSLNLKNIISVGRLDYQKGYDMLLKAWKIVQQNNKEWKVYIYGDGPMKEELIALAEGLEISKSIIFCGTVKNIKNKYLSSSIYLMSSRHEGFPLVLPEAMECGLPLISFSCPSGPSEVIENGSNGFLVENGNIDEMAEKILILMNDADKRKRMGGRSKEKSKCFDKEVIMKQWMKLFQKIINRKSRVCNQ